MEVERRLEAKLTHRAPQGSGRRPLLQRLPSATVWVEAAQEWSQTRIQIWAIHEVLPLTNDQACAPWHGFSLFIETRSCYLALPGQKPAVYIDQAGLELGDLSASGSQVLGLLMASACTFFLLKVVSLYSPGWPQIWSSCLSLLSHEVLPCLTKFPFSESVKTSPINIKHAQGPASQVWRRRVWLFGRFRRHNQGLNMHALFFANRPSSWLSLLSWDGDYGYVQHHPQPYRQQRPLCLFST